MANAILRLPEVIRRTGLRRTSIYARIAAGGFPRGFTLGGGTARGWLEVEVEDWISAQAASREPQPQAVALRRNNSGARG